MTTKPETGINPKLLAIAAQLDAAHECARRMEALQKDAADIDAAEDLCGAAYGVWRNFKA